MAEPNSEGRRRPSAAVWIATCGGIGYFPIAPGTAGSALGVGLAVALAQLPLQGTWQVAALAAATAAVAAVGVWAAGVSEKFFGHVDPAEVIVDEVAGQMLAFLALPAIAVARVGAPARWDWQSRWLLAGFILFRVFDITKPIPARRLERLPGGWGIVLDDIVAGAYALVALSLLVWVWK